MLSPDSFIIDNAQTEALRELMLTNPHVDRSILTEPVYLIAQGESVIVPGTKFQLNGLTEWMNRWGTRNTGKNPANHIFADLLSETVTPKNMRILTPPYEPGVPVPVRQSLVRVAASEKSASDVVLSVVEGSRDTVNLPTPGDLEQARGISMLEFAMRGQGLRQQLIANNRRRSQGRIKTHDPQKLAAMEIEFALNHPAIQPPQTERDYVEDAITHGAIIGLEDRSHIRGVVGERLHVIHRMDEYFEEQPSPEHPYVTNKTLSMEQLRNYLNRGIIVPNWVTDNLKRK